MQKVISTLEHLEKFASEKDKEKSTIDSLQNMVTHLELEENKKQEERQRNSRVYKCCSVINLSLFYLSSTT